MERKIRKIAKGVELHRKENEDDVLVASGLLISESSGSFQYGVWSGSESGQSAWSVCYVLPGTGQDKENTLITLSRGDSKDIQSALKKIRLILMQLSNDASELSDKAAKQD